MSKIGINLYTYDQTKNSYIKSYGFCDKEINTTKINSRELSICARSKVRYNWTTCFSFNYDPRLIKSNRDTTIPFRLSNYHNESATKLTIDGIIDNITVTYGSITTYNIFINLYYINRLHYFKNGLVKGISYDGSFGYYTLNKCHLISPCFAAGIKLNLNNFFNNDQVRTFILDNTLMIKDDRLDTEEIFNAFNSLTIESILSDLFSSKH